MAGDLNRATLVGRLGRDPEVRRLNSGAAVVSWSMATSDKWHDKQTGDRKERTFWHNVVCFNENIGKIAEQYLSKGSKCLVEGTIEHREYDDKDGVKRRVTEIVIRNFGGQLLLLDGKSDGEGRGERRGDSRSSGSSERKGSGRLSDEHDQDIPF